MHTPDQTPIATDEHFAFTVDTHQQQEPGEEHPRLSGLVRVLVGQQQLGLISSLKIEMSRDTYFPEIVVRFLEGLTPEQVGALSAEVQESVRKSMKLLGKFPFVQVQSPLILGN
jgi:hypothetical protein